MADELNGAAPAAADSAPAPASEAPAPASMPAVDAPATEQPRSFDESLKENAERIWAKHNPPREAGRFAPRNDTRVQASEAAPTEAAPDQPAPDQAQQATLEPAKPAIEPPHAWSAEEKALWAKVPPEVQAVMARRETEAHRQITQMGQRIAAHEPVRAVFEQQAEYLRQKNVSPDVAAQQLFLVSQSLDRDPAGTIAGLAQRFGVNLQALAAGQQQQPNRVQSDPQLVHAVRQLQAEMHARQEAEQAEKLRSITQTIEQFAKDTKEHPYFEDLESEIEAQVVVLQKSHPHLSPQELLAAAYNKAKWAHDPVRERILADQRKADEDKRKSEQEKQVKEARRQAPFTQKPGIGNSHVTESFEDTLRRNVQRVMGT